MHITRRVHVRQYVVLQLRYWLQRVRRILILLNVTDDFRSLCALSKVDEIRLLDQRGNSVLNEGQIGEVYT